MPMYTDVRRCTVRIYNQNVWGNMAEGECVGNRNALICDLIEKYQADICGFQECNPNTSRSGDVDLACLLRNRYAEVPTDAGRNNYTPIFYRYDRFSIVNSGWLCYSGLNYLHSKSLTWCVFEEKESGIRFAYISTHFWWKFHCEADFKQRLENVKQLHETVLLIQHKYKVPVLFSGDLNSGENAEQGMEPINEILRLGYIRLCDNARYGKGSYTVHTYPVKNAQGIYIGRTEPYYTLDHAFLYPDARVTVRDFVVDHTEAALSSSDHCPLYMELEIGS